MQYSLKPKFLYNKTNLIALFIIAIGILVRVISFGSLPYGFNQDEAFAAYESFSLLNYGVDSAGNAFPTYFVSWGSGMNVLQSYLARPFMLIFGYCEAAYRMPSLLCAIASLFVLWRLLKRLFNNTVSLKGLALLSICPWHVMLSRWGLESNLAPSLLLFGLYFLIKGIENNKYFLLSAIFYGLSLYAYSVVWISLPVTLIVFGIYIIKTCKNIKIKYVVGACAVLFVFALPHILFLLINSNVLPEIKTQFFTIPKMVYMRGSEISVANVFKAESWVKLFNILFLQNDSLETNVIPEFGMFYHISLPFFITGLIALVFKLKEDIRLKRLSGAYFILGGFLVYLIYCLTLFGLNVNKSNGMHIFTLAIISFGIYTAVNFIKHKKIAACAVITVFAICFTGFCGYYFVTGKRQISNSFSMGLGDSVKLVNQLKCKNIAVDRSVFHSQILFYDKTPQKIFENTVKYEVYPHPYLSAESFGKYTFISEYNNSGDFDAYIFPNDHLYFFSEDDFEITQFEKYSVAVRKD